MTPSVNPDPTAHEVPVDVVDHDTTGTDCICGPTVQPHRDDTGLWWQVTHYPLNAPERPGRNAHA